MQDAMTLFDLAHQRQAELLLEVERQRLLREGMERPSARRTVAAIGVRGRWGRPPARPRRAANGTGS